MKISYLPYEEIDKARWDHCIENAHNRLIYGFSFYLNRMATNWDGLILNDYEAVMPLPWRKKLQIKYLYQPSFMQQGGIFSAREIPPDIINAFIEEAAKRFKFAEITMNYGNNLHSLHKKIEKIKRRNLVLNLLNYENIYQSYDHGLRKSLRRIEKFNMHYEKSDNFLFVVETFKGLYSKRLQSFSNIDYENFKSVCTFLHSENRVITRLVLDPEKKLLAAMVLLKDDNRLYNLLSCITQTGKRFVANDYLYDKVINEFSGKGMLFDFEGSEVKGIADYYKKFNPELQPYHFVKYNELNKVIKLFKK